MLSVKNIDVFHGDVQAIWDVSLRVEAGEIVSIVGSNGAGKSTLLNTISGFLRPKRGDIEFLGQRIQGLPPFKIVELGISQVPEGRHLFPYMTVLENLEMGAYTKAAREKREESLERVFSIFPILEDRQKQLAGSLSGGEQQMLAIARGLMSRPKLLMLDEPSLGLAPKLVAQLFDVISKIREEGVSILLVEQNVYHSISMADRSYVLENGRMALEGSKEELLRNEHVKKAYLGL
ncbi:MAG: ABC transporter ATP-binding protein [Candidatus Bathyarchaeia archaeon]